MLAAHKSFTGPGLASRCFLLYMGIDISYNGMVPERAGRPLRDNRPASFIASSVRDFTGFPCQVPIKSDTNKEPLRVHPLDRDFRSEFVSSQLVVATQGDAHSCVFLRFLWKRAGTGTRPYKTPHLRTRLWYSVSSPVVSVSGNLANL